MTTDGSFTTRVVRRLMTTVRPGSTQLSDEWSPPDLASQVGMKAVAHARARLVLVGVHGGARSFVEPRVSIEGRRHLRMGSGCILERGVHLRAFGTGGLTIGNGVTIGRYSVVEVSSGLAHPDGEIVIGDGVGISDHCFLGGAGGLRIGDNTIFGQGVSCHPENHETHGDGPVKSQGVRRKGIVIGQGCWLGAGVRVLDGVTIGDNTTVGAGSVVTRDLPPNSVAYGVPARQRP